MSRIEDDREAQRVLERQTLKARQDQDRLKARAEGDSTFSRSMEKGHLEARKVQDQHLDAETHSLDEEATALADVKEDSLFHDELAHTRGREQLASKGFLGRIITAQKRGQGREQDQTGFAQGQQRTASEGLERDRGTGDARASGRGADGKSGAEALEKRGEGLKKAGASSEGSKADADAALRADSEGQKGGGEKKDSEHQIGRAHV